LESQIITEDDMERWATGEEKKVAISKMLTLCQI